MAENEAMEGKDYAQNEQTKMFEQMVVQAIKNREEGQEKLTLPMGLEMQVKKVNGVYKLRLLGEDIATTNGENSFSYDVRGLKNVKGKLDEFGFVDYNDLGLPDIKYLEERNNENSDGKDHSRETDVKERGEQGEEEKDKVEKDSEEIGEVEKDDVGKPKIYNKGPNWIKLDLGAQVVYNKTLAQILPNGNRYKEVYVAPGKDQFSYSIVGGDEKNGYQPVEGLEKTEGSNPNQKITSIQNQGKTNVETEQAFAMFKIRGRENEGFSINLAQSGNNQIEVSYWRKAYSDNYISIPIAQETADRGYNEHCAEARYFMAKSTNSNWGMDDKIEDSEDIGKISSKLPSEINPASDGMQLEEVDKRTFRERLIQKIMNDVMGTGKQHPDYEKNVREKATIMADKILEEGKDPEKAKEDVFGKQREEGGLTPDQKRNREG